TTGARVTGLTLGDRIQLKLIATDLDKVLVELDTFRDQKPGQRIRVLLRSGRAIEGVVNTASADHLSILSAPGDELHQIPARDIPRIQGEKSTAGVAIVGGIFGLCGIIGLVGLATFHSTLLGVGAAGGSIALSTWVMRTWARYHRSWFTI